MKEHQEKIANERRTRMDGEGGTWDRNERRNRKIRETGEIGKMGKQEAWYTRDSKRCYVEARIQSSSTSISHPYVPVIETGQPRNAVIPPPLNSFWLGRRCGTQRLGEATKVEALLPPQ